MTVKYKRLFYTSCFLMFVLVIITHIEDNHYINKSYFYKKLYGQLLVPVRNHLTSVLVNVKNNNNNNNNNKEDYTTNYPLAEYNKNNHHSIELTTASVFDTTCTTTDSTNSFNNETKYKDRRKNFEPLKHFKILPLFYSDVDYLTKQLLARRECFQFPCVQKVGSNDTRDVFLLRKQTLAEGCSVVKSGQVSFAKKFLQKRGGFSVCLVPKVGLTSWRGTLKHIRPLTLNSSAKVKALITVRHPFERLTSAYRDKYLNGRPISEYTRQWKQLTESAQSWDRRWSSYWLPALISSGRASVPQDYADLLVLVFTTLRKILLKLRQQTGYYRFTTNVILSIIDGKIYDNFYNIFKKHNYTYFTANYSRRVKKGTLPDIHLKVLNSTVTSVFDERIVSARAFKAQIVRTFKLMLTEGKQSAWKLISTYGYSDKVRAQMKEEHKDVQFTFQQFLEHVIWTHEMGLEDSHWSTYRSICNLCKVKYDYVIHLNNVNNEVKQAFKEIGYSNEFDFNSRHRSNPVVQSNTTNEMDSSEQSSASLESMQNVTAVPQGSYEEYFKDIPEQIIQKLRRIYFNDLLLFGYSVP